MADALRYAARSLGKSPGFVLIVVLVVGVGIGANTAIFSAVHALILRPLPYPEPHRLAMIWEDASAIGFPRNTPAPANYFDWKRQNTSFELIAASRSRSSNLTGGGEPELALGRAVTYDFFSVLGVAPLLGRTFTEREDQPDSRLVVISYGLWQRRYGGDPSLVGSDVEMNGAKTRVLGVMPRNFRFPDSTIEFWVPIGFTPAERARRGSHFLQVVGRLKRGVSIEQARTEMQAIARGLEQTYPEENRGIGAVVVPLSEQVLGNTRPALLVLMSAAGLVLLIACSNVANLLLVRSMARRREFAVRLALGAGGARIAAQMLIESLALAILGTGCGLLLARAALSVVRRFVPASAAHAAVGLNAPVLAFAAGVAAFTAVLFTIAPALHTLRSPVVDGLKSGAAGALSGSPARVRRALVIVQVALALTLSVGAGLMVRTLAGLRSFDPGFDSANLLTMRVVLPTPRYADQSKRLGFYDAVLERTRRLPGVRSAGFSLNLPYTQRGNTTGYRLRDGRSLFERDALWRPCTPDYLATLGVRLREGRLLNEHDTSAARPAVVINDTFARTEWKDRDPIGEQVQFDSTSGPWFTVVGVIEDVHERGIDIAMKPAAYVNLAQDAESSLTWLAVRTSVPPLSLARAVTAAIHEVDLQQPVASVRAMEELVDIEIGDRQQQMQILGSFSAIALLLAALGLYGVLAYSVAQRRREIGVRVALGARAADVVGIVVREGLMLTACGGVAGLVAAFGLSRTIRALLFGVTPFDVTAYVLAVLVLAASAIVACWLPARRALSVDPAVALREE